MQYLASSNTYTDFIERKHFKLLDGIRGLSIAAVIWHHSAGINPFDSEFFNRGYLGVDMFFVLSGFLITFLLLKEKRLTKTISLKKFYIRRTLRIFPLYFVFLGLLTTWLCVSNKDDIGSILGVFPYYFFYISNWIPEGIDQYFERAWSLAVEEQFYLVWPVIFVFIPLLRSFSLVVIFVCIVTFLEMGLLGEKLSETFWNFIPFRTLFLGCLLAITLSNKKGYELLKKLLSHKLIILVFFLLLLYSIARISGPLIGFDLLITHMLMVLFLASAVVNEENIMRRLLMSWPLTTCGLVSYGIYILHGQFWGITQKLVNVIPIPSIANYRLTFFLVFICISCFVAMLSYHYFEAWFLRLKTKYGKY